MSTQAWLVFAQQALNDGKWACAEGSLRRILLQAPESPEFLDLLGYALLMQGAAAAAEQVLRRAIDAGGSQFWTPHKLGDALRAQQRWTDAAAAYEQALAWGSDSDLTVRNLLHVLAAKGGESVFLRLEAFAASMTRPLPWQEPMAWQRGAIATTLTLGRADLAAWLCAQGCAESAIRRLAYGEALAQLNLDAALALLNQAAPGPSLQEPPHPQEQALHQRIRMLLHGCDPCP